MNLQITPLAAMESIETPFLSPETAALPVPIHGKLLRFRAKTTVMVSANTKEKTNQSGFIIGGWTFKELFDFINLPDEKQVLFSEPKNTAIHPGGWQSWSAGWELMGGEKLPRKVAIIPELIKLTNRDKENPPGRDWIIGHFIIYLRAGNHYFCIASGEGSGLAPLSFYINRKRQRIMAEVFAPGKTWKTGEPIAVLNIFYAHTFFGFKDALKTLYNQEKAFASINFLRDKDSNKEEKFAKHKQIMPGGYESWYNHYTDINEALILEDLEALNKTENLLKLRYIDRNKPLVFQIDDGWEKAVGDWEINTERFPRGLKYIAERIEAKGYIPGLWLAPFLVTRKSRVYSEKPEWLLRETRLKAGQKRQENLVVAGFNHLWDKQYYCLDLSNQEVLDYLKDLMDKVIDDWGFRYLKLDFLYAGLFSGDFTEGGSPHEHYEKACKILTGRASNAAGFPVTYLGCGVPLGASFRYFPLSRTGADTREEWDWFLARLLGHTGRPGAWINLRNTIGRTHLDNTVYISDPDVIFLRTKNCKLNKTEKELIALVNFLLAGQIMFSDDPLHLGEDDLVLTRSINSLYEKFENDEYGAIRIDRDVFRVESRSGQTSGLINLNGKSFTLKKDKSPELFKCLSLQKPAVDHRIKISANAIVFAPHSITIVDA